MSSLLKSNAEIQIQETTIQVSERVDTLYRQIDIISRQVITDSYVQQLLLDEVEGKTASFDQRQALMQVVNRYQAYSDGIHSFELYLRDYKRIFPLNGMVLPSRVDEKWIEQAKDAKGKLVWIGRDPKDPNLYLGIRQVSLIDRWFSNGGYLLTRIDENYFRLKDESKTGKDNEYMVIVDQKNSPVFSNYYGDIEEIVMENQKNVNINEANYIVVKKKSALTGWTAVILTPVNTLMNGLSVLRAAIIFSGIAGFSIFFFFSFILSIMITRPILNLIRTMQIAKLGGLKPIAESASTVELVELNKTYNQLVENTNHLMEVVYEKELCLRQAELKALQAQINPHFLYNTLEALYWSLEEKGEELAEVVVAMSDLFRYTISGPKVEQEWVLVKEELEHVERYLQVMKMRFGDRLTWYVSSPSDCNVKIPKLLIQPLVENAILHGVGNKNGQGTVSVIVEDFKLHSRLVIKVIDDGPGIEVDALYSIMQSLKFGRVASIKEKGMAIANVHKRLKLYYKDDEGSGLSIESKVNQGTCVTFEIPY
ncbi:sensor histidine kinase [Alkaliphilus metalliredigens]|uniref:sensor histidine kinase n=1 Tax=Alkaliphilus metalliredigens TaxID=208226 RepID=UPI0018DE83C1|nr:sensor histidine kinase [Alkaliphilus metalliredigens]